MDAHFDNYLVETFAVAVSLKVLKELSRFNQERTAVINEYVKPLSPYVQSAMAHRGWNEPAFYWQRQIPKQKSGASGSWDFSFATLGALILEASEQPVWPKLLGVAAINDRCFLSNGVAVTAATKAAEFRVCSPALRQMSTLSQALKALGYLQR